MAKNIGVDAAKLAGLQKDMMSKLLGGNLTIDQIDWWLKQCKEIREGLICGTYKIVGKEKETKSCLLEELYRWHKGITISTDSDSRVFADINNTVYPGPSLSGTSEGGPYKPFYLVLEKPKHISSKQVSVSVYEALNDFCFFDVFRSFSKDPSNLCWDICLEQNQIIRFAEEHPDKLHPKCYATFFLLKVENLARPLVTTVHPGSDNKDILVLLDSLFFDKIWKGKNRYRIVVPRLVS